MDYSELQNKAKENIIRNAYKLFANNGIHNVALVQIAKESEIGVATVYRYFGNKKNIINECANSVWKKVILGVQDKISSLEFLQLTGIEKIEGLLSMFLTMYQDDKEFLKFVSEFDAYIAQEKLTLEEMQEYNNNFLTFHEIGLNFFIEGIKDLTIKDDIDFDTFYYSITRALLDVSMKGANSPVLIETDKMVSIEKQLEQLITMAIYYCKKGE
ncbi:MAG: TetR/AcrR family transcriptional regulator [Sphaerochaeta sp.]